MLYINDTIPEGRTNQNIDGTPLKKKLQETRATQGNKVMMGFPTEY